MGGFSFWTQKFNQQDMSDFSLNPEGLLWLKIRSILRKELMTEFSGYADIVIYGKTPTEKFKNLFEELSTDITISHTVIDSFIRQIYKKHTSATNISSLVSQLYKFQDYKWGGDQNNSLDKFLVSHYVKAINDYESLLSKFEFEINPAVRHYVLNSWFNHWSSRLIEAVFMENPNVLPAIGKVKSVDFFIKDIPFDLKVTFLPVGFQNMVRERLGMEKPLTSLKKTARKLKIAFDCKSSEDSLRYELTERLTDNGSAPAMETLETIMVQQKQIIDYAMDNSSELACWLYENQGAMRFGAENRIYLVLIDTADIAASWKLKRNLDILRPGINHFIDNFDATRLSDLRTEFSFGGRQYNAFADVIFIVK